MGDMADYAEDMATMYDAQFDDPCDPYSLSFGPTCRGCGKTGLKWKKIKCDGKFKWRLFEKSNKMHECPFPMKGSKK